MSDPCIQEERLATLERRKLIRRSVLEYLGILAAVVSVLVLYHLLGLLRRVEAETREQNQILREIKDAIGNTHSAVHEEGARLRLHLGTSEDPTEDQKKAWSHK